MSWLFMIFPLYLTYYTLMYAKLVWKEGRKLASTVIALLAFSLTALSIWLKVRN